MKSFTVRLIGAALGILALALGCAGNGDGQVNMAWDVAVDASGNICVADRGNNRIRKFDSSLSFLAAWGSMGAGESDSAGNIYAGDGNSRNIRKYEAE